MATRGLNFYVVINKERSSPKNIERSCNSKFSSQNPLELNC